MATLLEIKDLRIEFQSQDGIVHAVNGISFDLAEGETLGIVGESGCGKTVSVLSLIRLIPEPPGKIAGGQATFQGKNLLRMSHKEIRHVRGAQIGMVFQDPLRSLNPVLTIGRQLTEAVQLHLGMSRQQARQRAAELLSTVGIPNAADRLNDYPHQFSGGMRQRVMIATALSCRPKLLIADEPTTALDVTIQAEIVDLVKKLRDDLDMAIIWITHDLAILARLAKRIIVMYAGFIVEDAPAKELYATPCHPYTLGLLGSLPRPNETMHRRLVSIEGLPPDLLGLPQGCPFAPRCVYAIDCCKEENPALEAVSNTHRKACWVDTRQGRLL
jgi:oligopeptide transport system ATP-binding protein